MYSCIQIKNSLFSIIEDMKYHLEDFVTTPGKDFLRIRQLGFDTMIKIIITLEADTINGELTQYFDFSSSLPSASAFCQQRAKLLPYAFLHIFQRFCELYPDAPTYRGYRLLACDGSECLFSPDETQKEYFSACNSYAFTNSIHLNALYDLMGNRYVDAILQPKKEKNESRAFCDMIDRFPSESKTIFIADRGYESYNPLVHIIKKNGYFLFRAKDHSSNGILTNILLPETSEFDCIRSITLTRSCSLHKQKKEGHFYKRISTAHTFDYTEELNIQDYDIDLRIVRIELENGHFEVLITNLQQEEFPVSELKKLYRMRWGIETSFREMKYALALTHFHAKKGVFIQQEIYAHLIFYNFCALIKTALNIEKETEKHKYQVNFTMLVKISRNFFRKDQTEDEIKRIISKYLLPVRPGRRYERKKTHKGNISFLYRN